MLEMISFFLKKKKKKPLCYSVIKKVMMSKKQATTPKPKTKSDVLDLFMTSIFDAHERDVITTHIEKTKKTKRETTEKTPLLLPLLDKVKDSILELMTHVCESGLTDDALYSRLCKTSLDYTKIVQEIVVYSDADVKLFFERAKQAELRVETEEIIANLVRDHDIALLPDVQEELRYRQQLQQGYERIAHLERILSGPLYEMPVASKHVPPIYQNQNNTTTTTRTTGGESEWISTKKRHRQESYEDSKIKKVQKRKHQPSPPPTPHKFIDLTEDYDLE